MLSRSSKVVVLAQLCILFTVIIWVAARPLVLDHVHAHGRRNLYTDVIEHSEFKSLAQDHQDAILEQLALANAQKSPSVFRSISALLIDAPPFLLAWIFFSGLLCFFALFGVKGTKHAVWLAPILVGLHGLFSWVDAVPVVPTAEESLFPTEQYVLDTYLDEPLGRGTFHQRKQLKAAWERYLKAEWDGPFRFNLARIEAGNGAPPLGFIRTQHMPISPVLLIIYVGWNALFATLVAKHSE